MVDATADRLPGADHIAHESLVASRSGTKPVEGFSSPMLVVAAARCTPWRSGNAVEPLFAGQQVFDSMFATIAAARRSIFLETYTLEATGPENAWLICLRRKPPTA